MTIKTITTMTLLDDIQTHFRDNRDEKAKTSMARLIPTAVRPYGLYSKHIHEMLPLYKEGGLPLVEALWESGAFEEQLLAAKMLGKLAKKNPDATMALVRRFAEDLHDWAVCDTLAMQGLRAIHLAQQAEIFALSADILHDENPWKRRFALVLLWVFCRYEAHRPEIRRRVDALAKDKEYYVKKAVVWLERELKKAARG